jgi:hypothetical protein
MPGEDENGLPVGGRRFFLEGRLRRYTRTSTGLHDTLVFGLLRND